MTASPPEPHEPNEEAREEFDQDAFDAAFAAEFGPTSESADESAADPDPQARRRIIAVVLTPIRSAAALAALAAMASLDVHVIPSKNGALAVRTIENGGDDADMLLSGAPSEAVELAQTLSRLAKTGVLLLTANMGTGQDGPSGTITGREYTSGEPGKEVPAGLVLANADEVLESLLIGSMDPRQAPGRLDPAQPHSWRSGGIFGTRRRKKR